MRLELRLARTGLRGWHVDLVHALDRRLDVDLAIRWVETAQASVPAQVERFLAWERAVHRLPRGGFSPVPASMLGDRRSGGTPSPDLVLDLAGGGEPAAAPVWTVTFDGHFGELSAAASLLTGPRPSLSSPRVLTGPTPLVAVVDLATGETVAAGRPGSERLYAITAALDDVLARTVTLIQAALSQAVTMSPDESRRRAPSTVRPADLGRRGLAVLAGKAVRRATGLLYRNPQWRVGWRYVDGPDVLDLLGHPPGGWQSLPDDGYHFYADPFPVVAEGRTFLFVEDFDHRVGRGVIAVSRFDAHGPVEAPRPVLEEDFHLSYPFVIADGGEWWMVPETGAAGAVELYRARAFPDDWVKHTTLLEGVEAYDVTVFRRGDRWWMSATVREGGSSSDAMHLWFAPALEGPWVPHPRNPVLIDISCARAGGRVVSKGGRLIRPAQDGSEGYGASLTFAEITALDEERFAQRVIGRLEPGPLWSGYALHTYNRAGRLECIDGSGTANRWKAARRAARDREADVPQPRGSERRELRNL